MTDTDADVSRRGFIRAAAGGAAATAATGTAAAQEEGGGEGSGGEPDFGGWFSDVSNFDGLEDMRGTDQVTVEVGVEANGGPYGYAPAAVHVDPGTTIQFEWTGNQEHNVVHQDGDFESDLYTAPGVNYEYTFEDDGIYNYYCTPHRGLGMKGSVVVGTDYPTAGGGGGGGGEPRDLPDGAKTLGVATGFVMVATLGLAYFFVKYGGDYGEFDE
ncbi:MAG: halocyanin domain-containing protein [Haloarculaceae archaeon]